VFRECSGKEKGKKKHGKRPIPPQPPLDLIINTLAKLRHILKLPFDSKLYLEINSRINRTCQKRLFYVIIGHIFHYKGVVMHLVRKCISRQPYFIW